MRRNKTLSIGLWAVMMVLFMVGMFAIDVNAECQHYYSDTGHCYVPVLVPGGISWDAAKTAAESAGGYLATITSAGENDFVYGLISDSA